MKNQIKKTSERFIVISPIMPSISSILNINLIKKMNTGHKRSLSSIYQILAKEGHNINILKQKINDIIVKTLIAGLPELKYNYKACQPQNLVNNMCFQILGFDIIITKQFEPLLLEVNHRPSFETQTPLDYHIKFNLIMDTLNLMNINLANKIQLVKVMKQEQSMRKLIGKKKFSINQKINQFQKQMYKRDIHQQANQGNFEKIFPVEKKADVYQELIKYGQKKYLDINKKRRNLFDPFRNQQFKKKIKINNRDQNLKNQEIINNFQEIQISKFKQQNPLPSIHYKNQTKSVILKEDKSLNSKINNKKKIFKKQQILLSQNYMKKRKETKTVIEQQFKLINIKKSFLNKKKQQQTITKFEMSVKKSNQQNGSFVIPRIFNLMPKNEISLLKKKSFNELCGFNKKLQFK